MNEETMNDPSNQQAAKERKQAIKAWNAYLQAGTDALCVFDERHAKYGPGNIAAFGLTGCVVRASDKIERLKRAVMLDAGEFDDESVTDSLIDLANYALIGLACLRGEWPGTEKGESP